MKVRELDSQEIAALEGTRHAVSQVRFPPRGMQPYYEWLMVSLHLLSEASLGALRVARADGEAMSVVVLPGRATVGGEAVAHEGAAVDLSQHNNSTVHVWLYADEGDAALGVDAAAGGWPSGPHIKLAEVTLAAGAIEQIVDRRLESVFVG